MTMGWPDQLAFEATVVEVNHAIVCETVGLQLHRVRNSSSDCFGRSLLGICVGDEGMLLLDVDML